MKLADPRLGLAAGLLLSLGWPLTLLIALAAGLEPGFAGYAVAAAGTVTGVALARREATVASLDLLPAVCGLHACAAMAALDPWALASAPLFLGAAALAGAMPRHALRGGQLLAAAVLAVAALAPGRDSAAIGNAALLAPVVLLVASVAGLMRGRTRPAAPVLTGDITLVHAPLARRDPRRLAGLLDLDDAALAGALIERSRRDAAERAAAKAALLARLDRAVSEIELADLMADEPAPAAIDPELDDRDVAALLAQVDAALRDARARRALVAERLTL